MNEQTSYNRDSRGSLLTTDYLLNMLRIGNNAVQKAQQRNRQLGIPNVYSRNGYLYYELPDGTITTEDPFENG